MLVVDFFVWWYGAGFMKRLKKLSRMLSRNADRFSISLLLKSLFKPFRQIDADGGTGGGIQGAFSRLLGNLISRFVGFFMRVILIFVGLITSLLELIFSAIVIVYHLLVPVFPIAGMVFFVIGWVPDVSF